ncbi:MAG: transglutaminase family protein [Bryobacterales bacterium]|nr:transglutaminase family protein [Bryobacterales bacterium]
MLYRASHITRYYYADAVATCHNEVRLRPRSAPYQKVQSFRLAVSPAADSSADRKDYFGNEVRYFCVLEAHAQLAITATSVVEVAKRELPEPLSTAPWESVRSHVREVTDVEALRAFEFTSESPFVPVGQDLGEYARVSFAAERPVLEAAADLSSRIHREFKYLPSSTTIDTTVAEVFRSRQGVCQDFAHVMIAMLRSLGLPARYVSGYLRSGAQYTGAEASHAWVSLFVPGSGWIDLDPTNNVLPRDGHITLAWGRDYGDVTPVKGVTLGGGEHCVSVEVRVVPVEQQQSQAAH